MKYMNMKKRYLPMLELQLFADNPDEGADSDDAGGDDPDDDDSDEDGEDEDEKKFSQKEVDDAVKKRIARERRKWQREQQRKPKEKPSGDKSGGADGDNGETEADKKAREAEEKAADLEIKWTCLEHDVRKDCVDDVLALAKVHISKDGDLDIEDAIDKVLEKYPQFKDGYEDQDDGSEDPEEKKKGWASGMGSRLKKPLPWKMKLESSYLVNKKGWYKLWQCLH